MIEINGPNCLATWLRGKPPELACALAARIALRMVPILKDALYTDHVERRAKIILPAFRALAALNFSGTWPHRFGDLRQAAQSAARLAGDAMSETYYQSQMNVIDSIEAVPEEVLYIQEMESDRDAVSIASNAVKAIALSVQAATEMIDANNGIANVGTVVESILEVAKTAHWAVDGATGYEEFRFGEDSNLKEEIWTPSHVATFWKAVERDVDYLEANEDDSEKITASMKNLSMSPLWADGIPIWASRRWSSFKENLPAEESWEVWTDWYEARLIGQSASRELESAMVTIADELWAKGPKQANVAIANLANLPRNQKYEECSTLPENKDYQVALSFAGEQREYVEDVAHHLDARGIAVFYDGFEKVRLWGKDGVEAFHKVYAEQTMHVVMFISEAYARKAWPRHERRSAFSRMLKQEKEYVVPVRFDETSLPGLPDTIQYLSATDYSPAELAVMIAQKVGIGEFDGKASDMPPPRMTSPVGEVVFNYSNSNGRYVIGSGPAEFETQWAKASNRSIYVYNDPQSINGVAIYDNASTIHEVLNPATLDFSSRSRCPVTGGIVVLRNTNGFYAAVQILDIKDNSQEDDRDELRFRYAIQRDKTGNFSDFRDLW